MARFSRMLTKKKALHLALALAKAGDSDLWEGEALLADEGLAVEESAAVKEIGRIVHEICRDYSYLESAAYLSEIASRSQSVIDMTARMEAAPSRRKERLENLYVVIRRSAIDSTELLGLVRQGQQPLVRRLAALLSRLLIPDE